MTPKFPLIPYADAMRQYGTDKPDLRNPIKMQDVSDAVPRLRLQGVRQYPGDGSDGAEVWAIPAPTGGNRAFCDRMNDWAKGEGQPGSRLHLLA